jgi:hypothetical protein
MQETRVPMFWRPYLRSRLPKRLSTDVCDHRLLSVIHDLICFSNWRVAISHVKRRGWNQIITMGCTNYYYYYWLDCWITGSRRPPAQESSATRIFPCCQRVLVWRKGIDALASKRHQHTFTCRVGLTKNCEDHSLVITWRGLRRLQTL